MQTELLVLTVLVLMAASGWIPFIVGVNTAAHDTSDFTRPADPALQRPWVHRAFRAHLNLLEQAVPFALLILILALIEGFSALTAWTAVVFLGLRVVHALGMISGLLAFPARPIVFTLGWVCCLILGYAIFATAP